jgi:hypothetical protein
MAHKIYDNGLADLGRLTMDRTSDAIRQAAQLVQNPTDRFWIGLAAAGVGAASALGAMAAICGDAKGHATPEEDRLVVALIIADLAANEPGRPVSRERLMAVWQRAQDLATRVLKLSATDSSDV